MAAPFSPTKAYAKLQQIQQGPNNDPNSELAILRISEPITSSLDVADFSQSLSKRTSDATINSSDNPTPASLEADLTHYKVGDSRIHFVIFRRLIYFSLVQKELFSKLRFSYLEQVTKEKFLRAIVGDPPLVVTHNENVELEAKLAEVKQELKNRKEEVRLMVEDMEKVGRELATREFPLYIILSLL